MFKYRLITTLILIPLVVLILFYAPPWVVGLIVFMMVLGGGIEWLKLIPIHTLFYQIIFISALIGAMGLCMMSFNIWLILGSLLWILIILAIVTFPRSQQIWGSPLVVAVTGLIVLPLFVMTLAWIYQKTSHHVLILYVFALVWGADIGAYLFGRQWGRHKLIPQVSPGKTIEGVFGGILLAMLIAGVGYYYWLPANSLGWFLLAFCTVVVSIFGDLFISILKRRVHLKDSGNVFPGHGGILDRLDSMLAGMPVFYMGLTLLPLGF